jgi:DNA topoisomerase-1
MGELEMQDSFETQTQGKKNVVEAIKSTAEHLGNTPSICRKCYVHPGVLDSYLDGSLLSFLKQYGNSQKREGHEGLKAEEARALVFLRQLSTVK